VVVGGNHPDYWENDLLGWTLLTNSAPMDFAARLEATTPEPSAIALLVCGAVGLLAARRRWKRSTA
jgi:hypothetical protein